MKGYVALFLHAHIPYTLHHGTWPHGMDWLLEAASECYTPLLIHLEELAEQVDYRLTLSFSPVLLAQMNHPDFLSLWKDYLDQRIQVSREDKRYFHSLQDGERQRVAEFWEGFYQQVRDRSPDCPKGFFSLEDKGVLELATTPATHPYLPLIGRDESIAFQVSYGKALFEKLSKKNPKGMWLPECGYRPSGEWKPPEELAKWPLVMRRGVDTFLKDFGIDYFLVDHHLTEGGTPMGTYLERFPMLKKLWEQTHRETSKPSRPLSPYYPYYSPAGCAFFTRDPKTGLQVWSKTHGYPGTSEYLEFHKKHFPSGLRYWAVTHPERDLAEKMPYDPEKALERTKEQADHFIHLLESIIQGLPQKDVPPIIVAPYDAELFGHWWFEGIIWLKEVLKGLKSHPFLETITLKEYLDAYPPMEVVRLPEGSWGEGGYHWVWLNEHTAWIWKHIYEMEAKLWDGKLTPSPFLAYALEELLLLESSDWPFLITTWSARDYGETRAAYHRDALASLLTFHNAWVQGKKIDKDRLIPFQRDQWASPFLSPINYALQAKDYYGA